MLKIKEAIVVEGRYDKNTLSQLVDGVILETSGFGIFKDEERLALLRRLAGQRGIIVLTDSDGAGFVIRNFLKGTLPAGQVKHAYIPDQYGRERRKRAPGKAGKLGVLEVALGEIALNVFLLVLIRQIRAEIGRAPHIVHRISRVRVGRKDIRHFLRTHLALQRVHHVLFQIVDRAEARSAHRDVVVLAFRCIERFHGLVERAQLFAVIICPHRQLNRLLFLCAACKPQQQRAKSQQSCRFLPVVFHLSTFLFDTSLYK